MQAAIAVGLGVGLVSEQVPQIQAQCASGNCTWPITPSLGFCGSCTAFKPTRICNGPVSLETCTNISDSTCSGYSCTYTFPDGRNITDKPQRYLSKERNSFSNLFSSIPTSGGLYNESGSLYVANFNLVGGKYYSEYTYEGNFGNGVNTTFTQCALWACVQAHNISVIQGKQKSLISKSWARPSSTTPEDEFNSPGSKKFVFSDHHQDSTIPSKVNLTISNTTVKAIKDYMETLLSATVNTQPLGFFQHTPVAEALWNASMTPDTFISSLALAMSNHLRSVSANNTNLFPATIFADEARVKVRWGWMAFPVVIVTVSVVNLLASMIKTRSSLVGLWKNSQVVLLSTIIGKEVLDSRKQLSEKVFIETPVELRRERDGWAFRAVED